MSFCPMCGAADSGSPCRVCGVAASGTGSPTGIPSSTGPSAGARAGSAALLDRLGRWPLAAAALLLGAVLGGVVGAASGKTSASPGSSLRPGVTASSTVMSTVTQTVTESAPGAGTETSVVTVTASTAGSAEVVDSVGRPTWAIVIESLPKAAITVDQARMVADIMTQFGDPLVVMDSDALSGLNGGYWVVGQVGYSSRASAESGCSAYDRDRGGRCYPKKIS